MTAEREERWIWPAFADDLLGRLALGAAELQASVMSLLEQWPTTEPDEAFVTRALTYPWARPAGSFVLEDRDRIGPVTPVHREELAALAAGAEPAPGQPRRYPLLAIGSNGAPDTLVRKFEYLPADGTRVFSIAGRLHDFDIGAVAGITPYGAFPATLVPSPGAIVECSLLWVTAPQLEALTWSELSYAIGRLSPIRFETPDHPEDNAIDAALVYIARWGFLTIDDQPVSLEAMPATNRTGAVWTQERLLEWAAGEVFGAGTGHRRLLESLAREPVPTITEINRRARATASPFTHDAWRVLPGTADVG
ncbi:MAG: hypothetical protein Q7T55_23690 [Solirubrobacteraceae bacterium]|nr:hypothetical protein [Solirubrobacteraceae bacterium]